MTTMTTMTARLTDGAREATHRSGIGITQGAVRAWLRLEGLAAFIGGVVLFGASGGNWLFIIPLILLPDISVAAYLAGPRIGSFTYNLFHNWVPGITALGIGVWLDTPAILLIAAILIAHVGMDRAAGYGLKLPTSFKDTHLGRMGRAEA